MTPKRKSSEGDAGGGAFGDDAVEVVGAVVDHGAAEAFGPRAVAVLRAPRPQTPAEVVKPVLLRHADRTVCLVRGACRDARGVVGEQLGRRDLKTRIPAIGLARGDL